MKYTAHCLTFAIAAVLLAGCKGEKEPARTAAPSQQGTVATAAPGTPQDPGYTAGRQTEVTRRKIGPSGGQVEIKGTGSPIDGVTIRIPAGALNAQEELIIGYDSGALHAVSGNSSGAVLSLHAAGRPSLSFAVDAEITVPVPEGSNPPAAYYIDGAGRLNPLRPGNYDRRNRRATFLTSHASLFTWIYPFLPPGASEYTTGFSPETDGFAVENPPMPGCEDGQCAGMSAFAVWYYVRHRAQGRLAGRFLERLPEKNITLQELISSRAQLSFDQTNFFRKGREQASYTDLEKFYIICNALLNTRQPVLLGVRGLIRTGAHAIVAYGYNATDRYLKIYDPNYPKMPREIRLTRENKFPVFWDFGFTEYFFGGDYDHMLFEPFENILADAAAGFHDTDTAVIAELTPAHNARSGTRTVFISGKVHSGAVLANRIKITAVSTSGNKITTPRDTVDTKTGKFKVAADLNPGLNTIMFRLFGNGCKNEVEIAPVQPQFIVDREPYPYTLLRAEEQQPQQQCDLKRIHASGAGWAEFQVSKPSGTPCWAGFMMCSFADRDGVRTPDCYVPTRRSESLAQIKANCPKLSKMLLEAAAAIAPSDTPVSLSPQDEECYGAHVCSRIILCGD